MEIRETRIGRFDQVRLLTTKNIRYLSAPPKSKLDPSGIWSVSSVVGRDELLCVHKSMVIKVPASDVLKIADYGLEHITRRFGRLSHTLDAERLDGKKETRN